MELAGVNMRLEAGVYCELQWHNGGEWAYVLKRSARNTILDVEGGSFMDHFASELMVLRWIKVSSFHLGCSITSVNSYGIQSLP